MNQKLGAAGSLGAQGFTEKQGQYLAFIYTYSHMFRRPPAEADIRNVAFTSVFQATEDVSHVCSSIGAMCGVAPAFRIKIEG